MTPRRSASPTSRWDVLFAVDLRSLAALRIALGLLLVVNLADRLRTVEIFYGSGGLLPLELRPPWTPSACPIPFHLLGDSTAAHTALLVAGIAVAVSLLVGFRSRTCAVLSWLFLLSLGWRNPVVTQGSDVLAGLLLFWSAFLPIGARFSLDARRARPAATSVTSVASAALLLQLALLYLFAGLHKAFGATWQDGTAIEYVLRQELWVRPVGTWMLGLGGWLRPLTHVVLVFEIAGPFLLFCTARSSVWRMRVLAGLVLLQLGFVLTIDLWLFPYTSTAALLPYLPARAWDRIERWLGRTPGSKVARPATPADALTRVRECVAGLALAYVLWSNVASLFDASPPRPIARVGDALGLRQNWRLYAPDPRTYTLEFELLGTTTEGETLVLDDWDGERVLPEMETLRATYRGLRYLETGSVYVDPVVQNGFARWIRRGWNRRHTGHPRLRTVQLVAVEATIELDGGAPKRRRKVLSGHRLERGSVPPVTDP